MPSLPVPKSVDHNANRLSKRLIMQRCLRAGNIFVLYLLSPLSILNLSKLNLLLVSAVRGVSVLMNVSAHRSTKDNILMRPVASAHSAGRGRERT